jgi:hypothetical protein
MGQGKIIRSDASIVIMPTNYLRDSRLSLEAKGLLGCLYDNSNKEILNEHPKIILELLKFGYLREKDNYLVVCEESTNKENLL